MLELDAYTARAVQAEKQIEILIKVRLRIKDTKTLIFLIGFSEYCFVQGAPHFWTLKAFT